MMLMEAVTVWAAAPCAIEPFDGEAESQVWLLATNQFKIEPLAPEFDTVKVWEAGLEAPAKDKEFVDSEIAATGGGVPPD